MTTFGGRVWKLSGDNHTPFSGSRENIPTEKESKMNTLTATCMLVGGVLLSYLYSSNIDLFTVLGIYVAEQVFGDSSLSSSPMPEPGDPRKTPQGVPYADLKHIVNADGLHLFCRYWEPDGPPRALVFVAHGAGEHSGPYDEIALRLKELSLLVFSHDHVGHGQSEGERMNIKDFHVYVRDSLQHVDLMKAQYPSLPIFILGHSMGGAISILTACERATDFAGVVLIAPMVQMNPDSATPFKVFMAKVMNQLVPSLPLGSIQSKWISRDHKKVESYDQDELNFHGGVRVSFGMQLMGATAHIQREIPSIAWPFLLLQGDADKLCDIAGARLMFEQAASTDKKLEVYEGAYHALHHELPEVSEMVLKEITSWLTERLSPPQQGS